MVLSVGDTIIDVIGFGAGLLVSASLLPQIYRAHKRRSTRDLSYFWQAIIAVGVAMQLAYLAYFEMWAVFVPLTGELIFVTYLFGLKIFLEVFSHEGAKALRDEQTTAGIDAAAEDTNASDRRSRLDARGQGAI